MRTRSWNVVIIGEPVLVFCFRSLTTAANGFFEMRKPVVSEFDTKENLFLTESQALTVKLLPRSASVMSALQKCRFSRLHIMRSCEQARNQNFRKGRTDETCVIIIANQQFCCYKF